MGHESGAGQLENEALAGMGARRQGPERLVLPEQPAMGQGFGRAGDTGRQGEDAMRLSVVGHDQVEHLSAAQRHLGGQALGGQVQFKDIVGAPEAGHPRIRGVVFDIHTGYQIAYFRPSGFLV